MKEKAKHSPNVQLKQERQKRGWSQKYVAQEVGTDAFTVSRWERGSTSPSPHFRQQLHVLFDLSVAELGLLTEAQDEIEAQPYPEGDKMGIRAMASEQTPVFDPAIPLLSAGERSLVGRDILLSHLTQQLIAENAIRLAFNGLPGVGKTTLATAIAHNEEVRAHFRDGVLWAGLGQSADLIGLLSHWISLLNTSLPDLALRNRPEVWAACVRAAIGERQMLIIIDDAWEIAHALALQIGGPNCTHLVTTRFPEIAQRFAAANATVIRELEDSDARLLLMRLAPDAVQAEPEEVQVLTAFTGGLPLALTLLGNYLRVRTYSGQPRRLRAVLKNLRSTDARLQLSEPQTLIAPHPNLPAGTPISLHAIISMSDRQISAQAQVALRALAIFPAKPNTFSETAATMIGAFAVEILDELLDSGLLESNGSERYTLHQTIADYAHAQQVDIAVVERFISYFVAYVETNKEDDAAISGEYNNIITAVDSAFERRILPAFLQGVLAFAPVLIARGRYNTAETYLQQALEVATTPGDTESQIKAWLYLGKIAEQQANYEQARVCWQRGLQLANETHQDGLQAELSLEQGALARQQGQPEQARQFFQQALEISRRIGDQYRLGATLRNLGILLRENGQPEQARQITEEALATFQRIDNQGEIARTFNALGVLARRQGQPEQAQQFYEQALAIFRRMGDQRGAATSLGNLSRIAAIYQGAPQRAYQLYSEALEIFEQLGDRRSSAQILHGIGSLRWEQGQTELANQALQQSLHILREIGDQHTVALTLGELGIHARERGQLEQADLYLSESYEILQQLKDRREEAIALRELGALARAQDKPERAFQLLQEALTILKEFNDRRESALTQYELGMLTHRQQRLEEAKQLYQEALESFRSLGDHHASALVLRELGILLYAQGQREQGQRFVEEAIETLHALGDEREHARSLQQLGLISQGSSTL